jgi:hypothetical protein
MMDQLIGAICCALEAGVLDQVAYSLSVGMEQAQMQGNGEVVALLSDLLMITQQMPGYWIDLWCEARVEVEVGV